MDAAFDFTSPNAAPPQLVWISSLSHENIAIFEAVFVEIFRRHLDGLDLGQIEKSILDVSDTQVRSLDSLFAPELSALRNAGSHISEFTKRGYFESAGIFPWIAEHRDESKRIAVASARLRASCRLRRTPSAFWRISAICSGTGSGGRGISTSRSVAFIDPLYK